MAKTLAVADESTLLLTLGEISQLVSQSHDLRETLRNSCLLIQQRFHTDVCSVYIVDRDRQELVLRATVGLRPESVGQVRMKMGEGLTGWVAKHQEPVNVAEASADKRNVLFPESGEEVFHSFVGVPLVHLKDTVGVLVVQHREPRPFTMDQVRLLTGVAAQLAVLVLNAQLTAVISQAAERRKAEPADRRTTACKPCRLLGMSAAPGFGHGAALRFEPFDFDDPHLVARPPGDIAAEKNRLDSALASAKADIDESARHLADLLGEQFGALMQAQRLMLEDSTIHRAMLRGLEAGQSVERAVINVCRDYLKVFQQLDNPFFLERLYDIKDVFRRLLLHAGEHAPLATVSRDFVVVAHEVSLLELFANDLARVRGIVVEKGGGHSHVGVLARSLRIPMVTHVSRLLEQIHDGDEIFLDGDSGTLYANPEAAHRTLCLRLAAERAQLPVDPLIDVPTPIRLEATVNLLPEVARTLQFGAAGVGLYRSEFLELARRDFPTEEEQVSVYRKMVGMLAGRPITIRTFDLRSEKLYGINPEFGADHQCWEWRLVDRLPHVQSLIRTQCRAILRAGMHGPVRLLFPMITSHRQLDGALNLVEQARASLRDEGIEPDPDVAIGLMVESPSAVVLVKDWVQRVDFIAIGSNDLLHFLLGIERADDELAPLKTPLDPVFLNAVDQVVRSAQGKPITVCGEAASHSRGALALAALGIATLSVPPDSLPKLRAVFAEVVWPTELAPIADRLRAARDADEVEAILNAGFPRKPSAEAAPATLRIQNK